MQNVKNYDMRFTIVDPAGTVSFVGDGFFLPLLVAACSSDPTTLRDLLESADKIDRRIRMLILRGLAIFDEHNVEGDYAAIHTALDQRGHEPVFRVVDERTRQRSLEPTKTGLILFNLKDRRIVQMLNHFYAVERSGEVHVHTGTRYSRRTVSYQLSESWSIVP
ncbi:MAG TPA: hypothetical protein VFA78_08795 [Chloroflexota bacterium]|nr:hypothetical protein [Chloroflexota bacterium]